MSNNSNDNPVEVNEADASATDQEDRPQTSNNTELYVNVNDEKELRDRLIHAFTTDDDDGSLDELRKLLFSISRQQQQQQQHHGQDAAAAAAASSSPVEKAIHRAMCRAADENKVEAVRLLFNSLSEKEQKKYAKSETEIDTDDFPFFPLHDAAYCNHDEVVLYLLKDCNFDPNRIDEYGRTPLDCYMTSYLENYFATFESCRVLLEHGADPNLGEAMHSACKVRDLLSLFLEHGAKPRGHLIAEVLMDGLEDNLDLLLQHGAVLEERFALEFSDFLQDDVSDDNEKLNFCCFLVREHSKSSQSVTPAFMQSALDFAIRHGDVRCCDVFLATGKVPSRWALHYAVRDGNLPVCQMMVQYGADPFLEESNNNNENEFATSLFHEAARQENTTILEFFLQLWDEHFSSTDGKNSNGDYPLHAACRDPKVSVQAIKILVEHQPASILTMVDGGEHGRGVLPFQLAGLCDANLDVIDYLLRRRPDTLGRLPGNITTPSTTESTMIITSRNTGSSHTVDVAKVSSEDCEPRKKKAKTMLNGVQ